MSLLYTKISSCIWLESARRCSAAVNNTQSLPRLIPSACGYRSAWIIACCECVLCRELLRMQLSCAARHTNAAISRHMQICMYVRGQVPLLFLACLSLLGSSAAVLNMQCCATVPVKHAGFECTFLMRMQHDMRFVELLRNLRDVLSQGRVHHSTARVARGRSAFGLLTLHCSVWCYVNVCVLRVF
jgi:hypothetical protein